jgi:hypothetical protein
MRWGKTVLLFQAVVTLILGIIFFAQVLALDVAKVSELRASMADPSEETAIEPINVKKRFAAAAYILLFVSLMELIIITKLLT